MADKVHSLTDEKLVQMEKRISAIYQTAQKDIEKKAEEYFKKFEKADEEKRKLVEKGELTEKQYQQWRQNKLMYGKRFTAMKEDISKQLLNVNQTATAYINGELPEVYALNYNALAETVDGVGGYSFTLTDANTVRNLATTDKSLLPFRELDPAKDIPWNMKKINSEVLQGIIQGESIPNIAKRIKNVEEMNKNASIRSARTIVTSAENKGRMDSYHKAEEDGIILQKEWIATSDSRTRDWHAELDGATKPIDKPFENAIGKIMFPGDPSADGANVYNCRCSMASVVKGFKKAQVEKAMAEKQAEKPQTTSFTPAKTIEEAEEYGKRFVRQKTWSGNGEISYKGLSVENANKMNKTLTDLFATYDMPLFENIKPMNFRQNIWKGSENAPFAYRSSFNGELYFNPKIAKNAKAFDDYFKKGEEAFEICKKNIDRFSGSQRKMVERYVNAGRQLVADDAKDKFVASIQHEFGHHIQNQALWKNKDAVERMNERIDEFDAKLSGYASSSKGEYVAESFCAFINGETERIDPFMKQYFEGLKKR